MKHAYACYLRLNCTLEDLKKIGAFKNGGDHVYEVEAMCQAYLFFALPGEMPQIVDFGDWSGGSDRKEFLFHTAVDKCKQLFPSLSGTFFAKKRGNNSKGTFAKKRKESIVDISTPASPSAHGTKKISFEVAIPKGLTMGTRF